MKIIFFLLIFFSFCITQSIEWQKTSRWKLYDIHRSGSLSYNIDTLKSFHYVDLANDSMQHFLLNMSPMPKEKNPSWMGAFIASCEINNQVLKIDISTYGGFIYVEKDKKYYQMSASFINDWLALLNRSFDRMPAK